MCCVAIGYQTYLLPSDRGMKLVELLQSAVECERTYDIGFAYVPGDQPEVTYAVVKASQIKAPSAEHRGERSTAMPLALGGLESD